MSVAHVTLLYAVYYKLKCGRMHKDVHTASTYPDCHITHHSVFGLVQWGPTAFHRREGNE